MAFAPNANYHASPIAIAKPLKDVSGSSQNQILQTPTEDDTYYKQLANDVSQSDGRALQDTLSETFKHHTVNGINAHKENQAWTASNPANVINQNNQYEVFSANDKSPFSLQFAFKIEEYFSSTWISVKTGNFTIQDIQDITWSKPNIKWDLNFNLDPTKLASEDYRLSILPMSVPTGYDADSQATRNNFHDSGNTPNGQWMMRNGSYSGSYYSPKSRADEAINQWVAINQSDFKRLINIPLGTSNISSIALNSLTFHVNFDADNDGHWNNTRTLYFNKYGTPTVDSNSTVTSNTPFSSTSWKVDRIYMTPSDLSKNSFDALQWVNIIHLYEPSGTLVDSSKIKISAANLNKTNNKLAVLLQIKNDNSDYYDALLINIPIHLINLDYLVKVANTSDPFWEHLSSGQTRYWSTKPTTKVVINDTFVKAIYVATGKDKLLKQLDTDAWGFIGNAKNVAIDKINGYALNFENYQNVLTSYQNQHDISVLQNLKPNTEVVSLINADNLASASFEDYLYLLKNTNISFDYGITSLITKQSTFATFNANGIVNVSDAEVQAEDPYKTTWDMRITNLQITSNVSSFISTTTSKLAVDKDTDSLKLLYDLSLKYLDASQQNIVHSYLYQTHGIDISQNISFKMEDGSMLDENFIVTKAAGGSKMQVGSSGYVTVRYWATFATGTQEYITLTKQGTDWISPKYGNKKITDLINNFDTSNLEYVFGQELQMIVNPYQNTSGIAISSSTPQSFGIDTVTDEAEGNTKTLESWTDGKWSHSTNASGHAIFDGIFGADPSGNLDENGRLASGKHHINITLQKQSTLNLKSDFTIVVDKQPVKIDVKSSGQALQQFVIKDDSGVYKDLYFSHGPIHFTTRDTDLADVQASFLDEKGSWYSLPINIKSMKIDNKWTQVIDSTVDYGGFAKVTITDQAGNAKTIYFYLTKDNSIQPSLFYDASLQQGGTANLEFNSEPLDVFKSIPNIITLSPIGETLSVTKMDFANGTWSDDATNDGFLISDYTSTIPNNYSYGKTIASSQSTLPFAGDELKPFLSSPQNTPVWPVLKKQIDFTKPGLYRINISMRLNGGQDIQRYIYIADPSVKPIDDSLISKAGENTNLLPLPKSDEGPKENLDQPVDLMTKLNINFPNFLIKDFTIKRSLLWYTEFNDLNINDLDLTKEGKYLISITDIFGNKYEYSLIVLDKGLDIDLRLQSGLTAIAADRDKMDDTAFWKGKLVWNYYRYEDEDHAKWEHDNFIDQAIKNGLTKEQAEALYQHLKLDDGWDGSLDAKGTNEGFDFEQQYHEMNDGSHDPHYSAIGNLSSGQLGGIIAGSVIGGIGVISGITWLSIIRLRRKAIK